MTTKNGTCENCGRENVGLISGDHCSMCYRAARGLKGEDRAAALAEVRRKYLAGEIKTRKGRHEDLEDYRDRKEAEQPGAGRAEAMLDPPPPLPGLAVERLVICFEGPDIAIHKALQEAYLANRRQTVQDEVLCILEAALQDRIFNTGYYLKLQTQQLDPDGLARSVTKALRGWHPGDRKNHLLDASAGVTP